LALLLNEQTDQILNDLQAAQLTCNLVLASSNIMNIQQVVEISIPFTNKRYRQVGTGTPHEFISNQLILDKNNQQLRQITIPTLFPSVILPLGQSTLTLVQFKLIKATKI
jgi:hypothetical protein